MSHLGTSDMGGSASVASSAWVVSDTINMVAKQKIRNFTLFLYS